MMGEKVLIFIVGTGENCFKHGVNLTVRLFRCLCVKKWLIKIRLSFCSSVISMKHFSHILKTRKAFDKTKVL